VPLAGDEPEAAADHSPLAIPIYRAVWLASMASSFGGLIQAVGASWMMTSLTPSAALIALVQASTTLPILLLALWAGAIADNFDRRRVILCAQLFMLLVSVLLTLCAWLHVITPWLLLTFTFLVGCGAAISATAWQASVGDMVSRKALPSAVALNSMGFNIARSVGPAIGGAIVASAGAAAAFLVNAFSYLGLIGVMMRWHPVLPPRTLPREQIMTAMAAGLRYMAMSPGLLIVLFRAGVFGVSASAVSALLPIVVHEQLKGGPLTFGVTLGAFGIGAVGGAMASAWLRDRLPIENLVRAGMVGLAAGCCVVGVSRFLPLTILGLLMAGACWLLVISILNATVQLSVPRWVQARALALFRMAVFGGMALGSWLSGELAGRTSVGTALLVAASVQAAGVLIGLKLPLREIDPFDLDPLVGPTEPQIGMPMEPRAGPIFITIEYRVLADHAPSFVVAMTERRRIRRRDGARRWKLLRDLHDPELWLERYNFSSWIDYVRHDQRATRADAANADLIEQHHSGPGRPVVRRRIERPTRLPLPRAGGWIAQLAKNIVS
jgi:MFS family permease